MICLQFTQVTQVCDFKIHSFHVALTNQGKSIHFLTRGTFFFLVPSFRFLCLPNSELDTSYLAPRLEESSIPTKVHPKLFVLGNQQLRENPHFLTSEWDNIQHAYLMTSWLGHHDGIGPWTISMAKPVRTGWVSAWAGVPDRQAPGPHCQYISFVQYAEWFWNLFLSL